MKYTPAFNVWEVPVELLKFAQPGQWVYAGDKTTRGRFWGVKRSGTVVVSWHENAKASGDVRQYWLAQRNYAKGKL